MPTPPLAHRCRFFVLLTGLLTATTSADMDLPFDTTDQGPLAQLYGLPGIGAAAPLAAGRSRIGLTFDVANHFVRANSLRESLSFDGETHRTTLRAYRGMGAGWEIGAEIPYVRHTGGFLDDFIEGWHDTFGLPQNGRDRAPAKRLQYRYTRDGANRLDFSSASAGLGDVRLGVARALWSNRAMTDAALRLSTTLPTGDENRLLGSGAPNVALWLSTGCSTAACPNAIRWFGGGGLLWTGKGDVLAEQQRRLVGFGSVGIHWRIVPTVTLTAQIDSHAPFYRDTALTPLGDTSVQLVLGGTWRLRERTAFEFAIIEDVAVDTAPDVVVRLGLRLRQS